MKSVLCLIVFISFINGYTQNQQSNRNKISKANHYKVDSDMKDKITINILIHFDKPLTATLATEYGLKNRRNIKEVSKNIIKDVEKLFSEKSLKKKFKFNLIDTRFLRNNSDAVQMNEDGTKYLKSYCEWQAMKKKSWGKIFFSVLITALDLYYIDGSGRKIRSSTGRGYLGAMCRIDKSCTIVEWHQTNVPYLLTHEIAHSLGMMHDGPPHNRCKQRGFLMGAKYSSRKHPRAWSPCNRVDLKRFLQSKKAWCLRKNIAENETID